ncbi:MAG: hypothetical protein RIF32_04995 [Leptospirales bacterium]|jgi:hypothetical protein
MGTKVQINLDRARDVLRRNFAGTPFSFELAAAAGVGDDELHELLRSRELYRSPDGWLEVRRLRPPKTSGLNTPPQKRQSQQQ